MPGRTAACHPICMPSFGYVGVCVSVSLSVLVFLVVFVLISVCVCVCVFVFEGLHFKVWFHWKGT